MIWQRERRDLKSGNAVGELLASIRFGSRLLNTVFGGSTRRLLNLWRSVLYGRKQLPSRPRSDLTFASDYPLSR